MDLCSSNYSIDRTFKVIFGFIKWLPTWSDVRNKYCVNGFPLSWMLHNTNF